MEFLIFQPREGEVDRLVKMLSIMPSVSFHVVFDPYMVIDFREKSHSGESNEKCTFHYPKPCFRFLCNLT